MHRGDPVRRERRLDRLAPPLRDLEGRAEQCLGRRRPEGDDQLRLEELQLGLEPEAARCDLAGVRLLVDAPLSLRGGLPLEMLDRIRDIDGGAVDAGVGEAFVEDPSGRPDERMALLVLLIAGLLADEDHLGGPLPLPEHALGRAGPQITGPAALDGLA